MKSLLTSREFWLTLIALFVLIIGQFFPGFKVDTEQLVALVLIVVAYLYGLVQDPGPGGWRGWLQSRKFWTAFVGITLIFLDAFHVILPEGFNSEMLVTVVLMFAGMIVKFAKEPLYYSGEKEVIDLYEVHPPVDEAGLN